MTGMVNKYYTKIIDGEMYWNKVTSLWNKKVQNALTDNGYVLNEDGTVTKDVNENLD